MGRNGIIIVRICEGLGNQLFQYAYARALKEKGLDVRLDLGKAYEGAFPRNRKYDVRYNCVQKFRISLMAIDVERYGKYQYIQCDNITNRIICSLARHGLWRYKFYEAVKRKYSRKFVNVKGNCYIKGWFHDERFFKHIKKELLEELRPKEKIRISKELREILEYEESVSIHIRRGDYVKIRNDLSISYYKNAVAYMKEHYHTPSFLIFSDDLDWVKRKLDIGDCVYINEDRKLQDYEELIIMSRCKSNIISNSTFSWWAAWLNRNPDKIIIAPKNSLLPRQTNTILL